MPRWGRTMRIAGLVLASLFAVASLANEFDAHLTAVLDKLLREIASSHRKKTVFVRLHEHCWSDERRQVGCVDLSDEVLAGLRSRGHHVKRVSERSRRYTYGHPSTHAGEFDPPPPDWEYLPFYTPGAEKRAYCEVELIRNRLYPDGAHHIIGRCYNGERQFQVLAGGDFLVKTEGETITVQRFEPPPDCILPDLPEPENPVP
jgi:hypothetical protein